MDIPEDLNIPEGMELVIPPTLVEINLNDGDEVKLTVANKKLTFNGQQPVMKGGEVFIPVNGVFEYLIENSNEVTPYIVTMDESSSTVTIKNSEFTIKIIEGEKTFTSSYKINGRGELQNETITPNPPQQRINGEFMLPLKAIAEAIGAVVKWDEATGTVSMFYDLYLLSIGDKDGKQYNFRSID
jgi:hypothetical protein